MPIVDNKEGKLCEYRDYVKLETENARLKAEVERLTKAGDTIVAAYCMGDKNKERWAEYPVVREWLAAKEGKQS
jgi:hypothetical protein